jgi:hypothetical protein
VEYRTAHEPGMGRQMMERSSLGTRFPSGDLMRHNHTV